MRRVDRWIFAPEDARRSAGDRIGLCLLLAYRLAAHDYDVLAARHVPFLPHFYMDVFAHMPSPDLASSIAGPRHRCCACRPASALPSVSLFRLRSAVG